MSVKTAIPLVNLKRQIEAHREEFQQNFQALLEKTDFIGGKSVGEFESAFAAYCGVPYCVGVGNGTDALAIIFRALDLEPGDEVITTPMSFMATAEVLSPLGLKVVFADIDPDTYTLSPETVAPLINAKTKALLPVHLYGQPAYMAGLSTLAEKHQLKIIEDCAQAHGARFNGQRAGSLGYAAAFSFYPGKNLGAFGDGGGIVTSDAEFAKKVRMLANHGRLSKYEHLMEGVNSRLDTFQASVLLTKLKYLDDWNAARQRWAGLYNQLLGDILELTLPKVGENRESVYHLYVVQTSRRDELLAHLQAEGIGAGIHYPIPLHLQPGLRYLGYQAGDFPVAEQLASQCLSLPLFPELTEDEVQTVASAVRRFFGLKA
jgi:dTDP-4-amino-4,6-dideoxygalactose transaminase